MLNLTDKIEWQFHCLKTPQMNHAKPLAYSNALSNCT